MSKTIIRWKKIRKRTYLKPWGFIADEFDDTLFHPDESKLKYLFKAEEYLEESSYREVSRWLGEITGEPLSYEGLRKVLQKFNTYYDIVEVDYDGSEIKEDTVVVSTRSRTVVANEYYDY